MALRWGGLGRLWVSLASGRALHLSTSPSPTLYTNPTTPAPNPQFPNPSSHPTPHPYPVSPRPLQLFLDLIVHFASRDLHLSAAFSRRFYWSDVIMWPEELPPGSTVVLGAADDLVHADEVGGAQVAARRQGKGVI